MREKRNRISSSTMIASAVAALFLTQCAKSPEEAPSGASASPSAQMASVKCVGGNDCKGKGACAGGEHDCKGKNDCKGKGFVNASSVEDCAKIGGHSE